MGSATELPEVREVPGPTVTIEADPPPPEVVTERVEVTVYEVPRACRDLADRTAALVANDGLISEAAAGLTLAAQDAQKFSVSSDPASMVPVIEAIRTHKNNLADAVIERAELNASVQRLLAICEEDAG